MNIDIDNYEEYLLSYIDGELTAAEEAALRQFMLQHPELKKELQWLEATKLPVEHGIIFRDKKLLYKQERQLRGRVVRLHRYQWASVAAACAALLVMFYFLFQKGDMPALTGKETVSTFHQPVKRAAVQQETVSPARPAPGKQKERAGSQKENTGGTFAGASPRHREKSRPVQKGNQEIAAGNGHLQLPALPVVLQKAALNVPLNKIDLEESDLPAEEAVNRRSEERKLLTDNIREREVSLGDKITHAASGFAMAKQEVDSTITQKLADINQKTSGFIANIAKNGIKIGRITFAFNH